MSDELLQRLSRLGPNDSEIRETAMEAAARIRALEEDNRILKMCVKDRREQAVEHVKEKQKWQSDLAAARADAERYASNNERKALSHAAVTVAGWEPVAWREEVGIGNYELYAELPAPMPGRGYRRIEPLYLHPNPVQPVAEAVTDAETIAHTEIMAVMRAFNEMTNPTACSFAVLNVLRRFAIATARAAGRRGDENVAVRNLRSDRGLHRHQD